MKKRIGVIADTITDTKMGMDYFVSKGYDVIMSPVKENSICGYVDVEKLCEENN